jgi:16S rRNA (guanine527-N7)-methyltransferase
MLSGSHPISIENIAVGLAPFGVHLATPQLEMIQKYVGALLLWNQKVSLTSLEDPLAIVSRHFGESIFAGRALPSETCRLADVGSGAGFPGLPLKIAFPDTKVVLIEPNLKKCAFLMEVITDLRLKGVQVFRGQYSAFREEDESEVPSGDSRGFDAICSRALGDYKALLQWSRRSIRHDGRVILLLGDEDAILLNRARNLVWDSPIRIPESRRRVIAVGRLASPASNAT